MFALPILTLVLQALAVSTNARRCSPTSPPPPSGLNAAASSSGSTGSTGSTGNSSSGASPPPAPAALNLPAPSTSGALTALRYTNVGGTGTYNMVTSAPPGTFPTCSINSCIKQPRTVSGNLAPFDDELTMVFRGPTTLHNLAVYQPGSGSTWSKTSSWSSGQSGNNLVFMNNKGGGASGEWSICQGASQSFASNDFTSAAASPGSMSGVVPAGQETNIMTSSACTSGSCTGFYRGTANNGWSGSKMFVIEFEMPMDGSAIPAIWLLNAQIVRSAQYGCNCRLEGPEGCGELDVLETLSAATGSQGISEIYSFKGATGTGDGNFFPRPTSGPVTYAVILDVQTDTIAIQRWNSFDFGTGSFARSDIDGYLQASAMVVPFSTNKRRAHRPTTFFGHKRQGSF